MTMSGNEKKVGFTVGRKGMWIKTSAGYTVSIQFGVGNYCGNRTMGTIDDEILRDENGNIFCETAEIAVWETVTGKWCTKEVWKAVFNEELNDDVVGWLSPDKVVKVLEYCSNWSTEYASIMRDILSKDEQCEECGDFVPSHYPSCPFRK